MVETQPEVANGGQPGHGIQPNLDAEETTQMTGILQRIQELFYENSTHKDGPKAGKVDNQ